MEKPVLDIYQALQKLIGLHRQLMDITRAEREALVSAELKQIQDVTVRKQALIEAIGQVEAERQKHLVALALIWKKPIKELTLSAIILLVQARDMKLSEQMRSTLNALTVLIEHISQQNRDNQLLLEKSLEHIHAMKKNVLGEANPKASTYSPQGQKTTGPGGARFISKEA